MRRSLPAQLLPIPTGTHLGFCITICSLDPKAAQIRGSASVPVAKAPIVATFAHVEVLSQPGHTLPA
jgi:hypothetical protein